MTAAIFIDSQWFTIKAEVSSRESVIGRRPRENSMSTFVLVHGSWHGGWCWKKLTPGLATLGHDYRTPSLSGMGEHYHTASPNIDLSTHTLDIANFLEFEDLRDVILLGHSYGGMVITGRSRTKQPRR